VVCFGRGHGAGRFSGKVYPHRAFDAGLKVLRTVAIGTQCRRDAPVRDIRPPKRSFLMPSLTGRTSVGSSVNVAGNAVTSSEMAASTLCFTAVHGGCSFALLGECMFGDLMKEAPRVCGRLSGRSPR
jgi:hypothetical protein